MPVTGACPTKSTGSCSPVAGWPSVDELSWAPCLFPLSTTTQGFQSLNFVNDSLGTTSSSPLNSPPAPSGASVQLNQGSAMESLLNLTSPGGAAALVWGTVYTSSVGSEQSVAFSTQVGTFECTWVAHWFDTSSDSSYLHGHSVPHFILMHMLLCSSFSCVLNACVCSHWLSFAAECWPPNCEPLHTK